MKFFTRLFYSMIFLTLMISLGGCFKKDTSKNKKAINTYTVKLAPVYTTFYFSGNLMPFQYKNVTSPTEGAITQKDFTYGQTVKQGQLLFKVQSNKQAQAFSSALSDYLKAKESFNQSASTLQNDTSLWKNQLISRDTYVQSQNSYYLGRLSLLKAQEALVKAMQHYQTSEDVFSLSISDISAVTTALNNAAEYNSYEVRSPTEGVALFPIQDASSDDSGSSPKKVEVGTQVKDKQLLVTVGEFKGMSLTAKVSEIEVNKLKPGMKVDITSVALPDVVLNGYISTVDSQASDTSNIPQFGMKVAIPKIPIQYKDTLKIGMSAKAAVRIASAPQIQIPIAAVQQNPNNGQTYVEILNKDGKPQRQNVETGATSMDGVIITSGLKSGDQVVIKSHTT